MRAKVLVVVLLVIVPGHAAATTGSGGPLESDDQRQSAIAVGSSSGAGLTPLANNSEPRSTNQSEQQSGVNNISQGSSYTSNPASTSGSAPEIDADFTVHRTPENVGQVRIVSEVYMPEGVVQLRADPSRIDSSMTVESSENFQYHASENVWEASSPRGQSTVARLTYTVDANITTSAGGFDSVETSDWALLGPSQMGMTYSWRYYGTPPTLTRSVTVDEDGYGASNGAYAFAGSATVANRSTGAQRFTVVIPDATTDAENATAYLNALEDGAAMVNVSEQSGSVTAFIAPDPIRRGGRTYGAAFYVSESSGYDVLLHEYIHTRQVAQPQPSIRWATEGMADYYGSYLTWKTGYWSHTQFQRNIDEETDDYNNAVLQDPDAPSSADKNYQKGRRVLAALDSRIRNHPDSNATLEDVFRALYASNEDSYDYGDFRTEVVAVTNESTGTWLDTHVQTTAAPEIPDDILMSSEDTTGGEIADRQLSANRIPLGGGQITVTVEATAQEHEIYINEQFSPAVAGTSIESVTVNGNQVDPPSTNTDPSEIGVFVNGIEAGDTVVLEYTMRVSNTADIGATYDITGTVVSDGETAIGRDQVIVRDDSPLSGLAADYDRNSDGEISAAELGDAGQDFAQGEISAAELGEVGERFARS